MIPASSTMRDRPVPSALCAPSTAFHRESSAVRSDLVWLFLGALGLRFVNLLFLNQTSFWSYKIGDAARYDAWARDIAAGNWFGQEVFYQAPFYPYFLAAIYSVFGDHLFVVRLIQAALGAGSCCLLAAAAGNLFGRRTALYAGWLLAIYAPTLFLETLLQKSVLDLFFVCASLWLFSRALRGIGKGNHFGLGLCLGCLTLCRENAVVLLPLFVVWAAWFAIRKHGLQFTMIRRASLAALAVSCGAALILGPVVWRNHWISGEWHLTTSQLGPNFYIGNNPKADGYYQPLRYGRGDAKYEQQDAIALAEEALQRKLSPKEVSQYFLGESAKYICQQPLDWIGLLGKKVLLSVNRLEIIDTEDQYVAAGYSPVLWCCGFFGNFGVVMAAGLAGALLTRRRWRQLWPLYLTLGLFSATLVGFFVFGRYRFPVAPLLILFAAPFLRQLVSMAREKGWFGIREMINRHPRTILAATGVLLVSCFPIIDWRAAGATSYNNFAIQALFRRDWMHADEFVTRSLELNPYFALAHNTNGVLKRELGDEAAAAREFQKAIRISPGYETAKDNLRRLRAGPDRNSTGTPQAD